eukprot:CAMPEP_0170596652 /NCGR_PEP_ID=MMETSP0224-20130122/15243_1 /TAXON_ID=285029 /ORGANISM="Togula jolla, Strain CCCM 725" /LENGTH=50 /DNA_ID=CAMNT_0010920981 /DNA_START=38 /DNA_END=186 /DNA_ORIENTATION=-
MSSHSLLSALSPTSADEELRLHGLSGVVAHIAVHAFALEVAPAVGDPLGG